MAEIKVPKTEEAYINDIYNRQKESTLRTLKSAYDSNVASIDTAKKALDTNSYEAKREAAGDAAITRQRLNEAFAANGLNTGAVGQANLALLNQKAENLNKIDLAKQQAQQEYDAQKAALMQAYQAEVKSAIQQNDAQRAQALYAAWKEQQAQANAIAAAQAKALADAQAKAPAAKQPKAPYKRKKKAFEPEKSPETATDSALQKQAIATINKQDKENLGGSYYSRAQKDIENMPYNKGMAYLRDLRDNNYITTAEYTTLVKGRYR